VEIRERERMFVKLRALRHGVAMTDLVLRHRSFTSGIIRLSEVHTTDRHYPNPARRERGSAIELMRSAVC